MKTALVNGIVITPNESYLGGLIAEGETIVSVFRGELKEACDQVLDVGGRYIAPGFIDLHVHGGALCDFLDGTSEAYEKAARLHLEGGTTAMMPTMTTCPLDVLKKALDVYPEAEGKPGLPMFLGAHLEGPYFALERAGGQDPGTIRDPDPAEYLDLLDRYPFIKRWSVAVERPGALEMGMELRKRGVLAAIGHTDAMDDDMRKAADYGYTLLTHFYSCMSTVRRINAYRHAGVIESGYLMDDFAVEIIADGSHLPASLLKLIYKSKGSSSVCLVTDALAAAGAPEGYRGKCGPVDFVVEKGVAWLLDRSAFAGSVATTIRLVRTKVELAEVPLWEAVKMMSLTPARVAGVDHLMGSLVPGKLANVVVFDGDYQVDAVLVRGKAEVCKL